MLNNIIKTTIILPSLRAGGAERVMSFVADNLDRDKFDVTLLVIGSSLDQSYSIRNISLVFLNKKRVLTSIPKLIQYLFQHNPQIVLSSIGHLNLVMGLISFLSPKTTFIGRHTNMDNIDGGLKNSVLKYITKIGLGKLDYIICQSTDMLQKCKDQYKIKAEKLKIINNPITDNFTLSKSKINLKAKGSISFITVGRLVKVKGHVRILEVLADLNLPFNYTIIGVGPEKSAIIDKVTSLNISNRVEFIDYTDEVAKYLADSDIFLQGSFTEGFPNALLESCAVGTPVIAYDAPGGTKEIIENGVNGFIVQNEREFLNKINYLVSSPLDPQTINKSVFKKFSKEEILLKYEQLFLNIIK
ncbi:glycosyltransferase [Arenibacter algicola]|uniref:glycosyltransferase n=1 Tax=Arenibacter algicola TaxID=616991 RepID=UPI0004DF75E9|nr:glycosyltransferase [Arenibacter algicola]